MTKRFTQLFRSNKSPVSTRRKKKKADRKPLVETLERRAMMAGDTYFAEDFQLLKNGNTLPAPIGEYDTSVARFRQTNGSGNSKIESDGNRYLGYNRNKRLTLKGGSSGTSPRAYLRSGENAVEDSGRFQFEYRKQSGGSFRVRFGQANSASSNSLSESNSIVKVEFLTDDRIRIYRPNGGSVVSQPIAANDKTHVVWFDFTPGTSGTRKFKMFVDGERVTANGQSSFDFFRKKGKVDAMQFEGKSTSSKHVYIDNLVLHNDAAAKNFFVDGDHPQAQDIGGRTGLQGKSTDRPFKTADYAFGQLRKGDTLFMDGTKFTSGAKGYVYRTDVNNNGPKPSTGTLVDGQAGNRFRPVRIKGWRGVPTINSMYQPKSSNDEWVKVTSDNLRPGNSLPSGANIWYFESQKSVSDGKGLAFRHASHKVGGTHIPMTLMMPNNETKSPKKDGKVQHLRGSWQWTRTFEGKKGRIYVRIPQGASPYGSGADVQISGSLGTLDVRHDQHHVNIEDLAVRGGYYGIRTAGDFTSVKRTKVENTFSDGIKGNTRFVTPNNSTETRPGDGKVIDSLVKYFGESGIDITGGSRWVIVENTIKFDINNRLGLQTPGITQTQIDNILGDFPSGSDNVANGPQGNGIMIKGVGSNTFVIRNTLDTFKYARQGVITVGGSTNADPGFETINMQLKGNTIKNVKNGNKPGGEYAIVVTDSLNATIENNTVKDSIFKRSIVQFQKGQQAASGTNRLRNNNFYQNLQIKDDNGNATTRYLYRESGTNGMKGTEFKDNKIPTGWRYLVGGSNRSYNNFRTYAQSKSWLSVNDLLQLEVLSNEIVDSRAASISDQDLQAVVTEATSRWQSSGVDTSALEGVSVTVGDLDGTVLGVASSSSVVIDTNAAGHGWYLDDDLTTDSEFDGHGPEGVDLLTTVMHELGHVLGFGHTDRHGDLMSETLGLAERFKPDRFKSPQLSVEAVGVANSLTPESVDRSIDLLLEEDALIDLMEIDNTPLQAVSYRIDKHGRRSTQPASTNRNDESEETPESDLSLLGNLLV